MQAVVLHLRKYVAPRPPDEEVSENQIEILDSQSQLDEFIALCKSAGHQVVHVFEQRERLHKKLGGLGFGKLMEIQNYIRDQNPEVLIINRQLQSSTVNQIENILQIPIIDRIQLILQIFGKRAQSEEAKLQVELAKLQYELPRIRREVRFSLLSERTGFLGVGEHVVNIFLQSSRKRVRQLKAKLANIRVSRRIQRSNRKNLDLIALAGYTGSGKSTLLNQLTKANVPTASSSSNNSNYLSTLNNAREDPGLFTTLSTTTRRLNIRPSYASGGSRIVTLTDTVGFIEALPPQLLEPFHSTLEETINADLLLLVLDASEPEKTIQRKMQICYDTLTQINQNHSEISIVYIFNKIDLLTIRQLKKKVEYCLQYIHPHKKITPRLIENILAPNLHTTSVAPLPLIPISAKENINLDYLVHQLYLRLPCERLMAFIPWASKTPQIINQIYDSSIVLSRNDTRENIGIEFEVPLSQIHILMNEIKKVKGIVKKI